jgi:alkylhydroperoxidase family enzyme
MADSPVLRVISPDASPEELAAITAAIEVVRHERALVAARAAASATGGDAEHLDAWVRASRLTARRAGLLRGPWRLSGRIDRRARA